MLENLLFKRMLSIDPQSTNPSPDNVYSLLITVSMSKLKNLLKVDNAIAMVCTMGVL